MVRLSPSRWLEVNRLSAGAGQHSRSQDRDVRKDEQRYTIVRAPFAARANEPRGVGIESVPSATGGRHAPLVTTPSPTQLHRVEPLWSACRGRALKMSSVAIRNLPFTTRHPPAVPFDCILSGPSGGRVGRVAGVAEDLVVFFLGTQTGGMGLWERSTGRRTDAGPIATPAVARP